MKISELKKIIRQNIIQELDSPKAYRDPETFEREYEEEQKYLNFDPEEETDVEEIDMDDLGISEQEEEEEDIEITADEETETDTATDEPALSDDEQEYLNTLEDLKNKAKSIGDEKLEKQIDNTITYFTRQHIVKEGMGPKKMNELDMESLNRMDELVNQNNLRMLITAAQGIIKDLEEFEDDDIFDFIVNKIKELDMPTPGPVRENYDLYRMKRLAGLIK